MKRALSLTSSLVFLVVLAAGCGSSGDPAQAETQRNFGVRMARMNLWREAMFRFKRAVEIAPDDAMAHNNLAVAYEANGDFENAEKEYRIAMRLDKSNTYIQKNYSRLVEFNSRNKKRQQQRPGTAPAPAPPPATTTTPAATTTGGGQ